MESKSDAVIVASSTTSTPAERARQIDYRIREIENAQKKSFIELGALLIEAEQRGLHEFLRDDNGNPYRSHDHWISVALPYSRSSAYSAKRLVRELCHIPLSDLREVSRSNLEVLRLLPESKQGRWVEKAKTLGNDRLLAEVSEAEPDLHIEGRRKMTLNFSETDHELVNAAIGKFQMEEGTESREAAIVAFSQDYLSQ